MFGKKPSRPPLGLPKPPQAVRLELERPRGLVDDALEVRSDTNHTGIMMHMYDEKPKAHWRERTRGEATLII